MARTAIGCAAVFLVALALAPLLVETGLGADEPVAVALPVTAASFPAHVPLRAGLRCSPDLRCAVLRGEDVAVLP